jgi:hypothetical protein
MKIPDDDRGLRAALFILSALGFAISAAAAWSWPEATAWPWKAAIVALVMWGVAAGSLLMRAGLSMKALPRDDVAPIAPLLNAPSFSGSTVDLAPPDSEPWRAKITAVTRGDGHACESPHLAPGESWTCECGNVLEMRDVYGDGYYVQPSVTPAAGNGIAWMEAKS